MSLQANEECQMPGERYIKYPMEETKYDSTQDTKDHIDRVATLLNEVSINLIHRASIHDASKLESPEKEGFDACVPKLKNLVYGSDEYKNALKEIKPTLDHHYANNSHHPEHYSNGINDMSLFDILEMLLDWKAATERMQNGGDIWKSIEHNEKRFNISEQLTRILQNTVRELNWKKI